MSIPTKNLYIGQTRVIGGVIFHYAHSLPFRNNDRTIESIFYTDEELRDLANGVSQPSPEIASAVKTLDEPYRTHACPICNDVHLPLNTTSKHEEGNGPAVPVTNSNANQS